MRVDKHKNNSRKKQQGATLITVMIFLMVMTVVGVSSNKRTILDMMVASNDHQQMQNYQSTANTLSKLTSVINLYDPLVNKKFNVDTGVFTLIDSADGKTESITDHSNGNPDLFYVCGGFDGDAISIGPDVPRCFLYGFEVKSSVENTGVRDKHNRGAGKEKPNPGKNSAL